MKKNKALRIGSCLAVVALLSTCLVAGTFAKYTTSGEASDNARVARFGVTIDPTAYADIFSTADGTTVKSANSDNVVAPGTKGEAKAVTVSGTPEVAVKVSNTADITLTGWADADGAYYCPLTVKVGDTSLNGNDYASAALFEEAIEKAVSDTSANYNPGVVIDAKGCPSVSWEWAFDENGKQTNAKDTVLGQAGTATIGIEVTTTVTQID